MTLNDKYEVVGEVGRGKAGIVYKAMDHTTGLPVAIKVLHEEVLPTDKHFERFKREAENASVLHHENIVKIHGFGIYRESLPYVAMEYVTGPLLSTQVNAEGRISMHKALPILLQICDAMMHAHEIGIVHRDLRPDNIFLVEHESKQDHVKIVDFGVAKNLKNPAQKALTEEWELLGTPEYMSPEQILGYEVDLRTDIYSMGCLMYNVLSGQLPYTGRTQAEVFIQKCQAEPHDFSDPACGRHIPSAVQGAVKQAIKRDPAMRQQSMQEIKDVLMTCPK
jgi:eukaryotic-like serine/threonine-protein kinase